MQGCGETREGWLCVYINDARCSNSVKVDAECFPDVKSLICRVRMPTPLSANIQDSLTMAKWWKNVRKSNRIMYSQNLDTPHLPFTLFKKHLISAGTTGLEWRHKLKSTKGLLSCIFCFEVLTRLVCFTSCDMFFFRFPRNLSSHNFFRYPLLWEHEHQPPTSCSYCIPG